MAQIVTITNPLTGQPVQVDQLDHTAQQIDDAIARALPGGAIDSVLSSRVNPNLLDNWYFGNPVDQRGGYVVPPGVTVYESDFTTPAGTTDKYYTLVPPNSVSDGNYFFGFNGKTAFVKPENAVRGYTGTRHAIDRWKSNSPYTTVLIKDDCVEVISTADSSTMGIFSQPTTLNELRLSPGDTVTLSFLSEVVSAPNGDIRLQIDNDTKSDYSQGAFLTANIGTKSIYSITKTIPETWEKTDTIRITMFRVGSFDVKEYAAKLELGTQQTLAHQDADGNWVLNEIPDYGEQLRRCLRHDYIIGRTDDAAPVGLGTAYSDTAVLAVIELPETMRANPAVSITGFVNLRFSASKNISVSSVKNYGFSGDKVQMFFDGLSGLTQGQSCDIYVQQSSKLEFNSNL